MGDTRDTRDHTGPHGATRGTHGATLDHTVPRGATRCHARPHGATRGHTGPWPQQTSCELPDVRGVRTPCRGGVWDGVRDGGCGTGCGTGVLGPIKEHPCVSYDLDDNYLF